MIKLNLVLLILVALAGPVRGEIIEFDMPGFLGHYPDSTGDFNRSDTLVYPGPSATLRAVTLQVGGTATTGLLECCLTYTCPDTTAWTMETIGALFKVGHGGFWYGGIPLREAGEFEHTVEYSKFYAFARLDPGDVLVATHILGPAGYVGLCTEITAPPEGDIHHARLTLQVEPIVPVHPTTWGGIKAMFGGDG